VHEHNGATIARVPYAHIELDAGCDPDATGVHQSASAATACSCSQPR